MKADARRVGVLGGTFDPPHAAHLALARAALEQLDLDRVIFVPAGDPWRKSDRGVTAARYRLAMVRLAVAGETRFEVSDAEVRRRGPSYTADTLAELRGSLGADAELFLIMGQDALEDLPDWKDPCRILDAACLAVAPRSGAGAGPGDLVTPALERRLPGVRERVLPLDMPPKAVSATAIRDRARRGEDIGGEVPTAVAEYARAHGLYPASAP